MMIHNKFEMTELHKHTCIIIASVLINLLFFL